MGQRKEHYMISAVCMHCFVGIFRLFLAKLMTNGLEFPNQSVCLRFAICWLFVVLRVEARFMGLKQFMFLLQAS